MKTRLSVLLITYNHEAYLERALDSVLMQRLDEPFEIVVADDASTDSSMALIRKIASDSPGVRFRYLDASVNLGITRNYQRAFRSIDTEFVAVIEGDDYWVSPDKLQTQMNVLDAHRECDLCACNYYVYEQEAARFVARMPPSGGYRMIGARDLIADNLVGNFSTCMYRVAALRRIPEELYDIRSYDWIVNICVAMNSLICFSETPMSVYRVHSGGSWSLLSQAEKLRAQIELIPQYDQLTRGLFSPEFNELKRRLEPVLADMLRDAGALQVASPVDHVPPPPARAASRIGTVHAVLDWLPPFVLPVLRQLLPPALKRRLLRSLIG